MRSSGWKLFKTLNRSVQRQCQQQLRCPQEKQFILPSSLSTSPCPLLFPRHHQRRSIIIINERGRNFKTCFQPFWWRVSWISNTITTSNNNGKKPEGDSISEGASSSASYFDRAMVALEQLADYRRQKEDAKSAEQYEAYQKSSSATSDHDDERKSNRLAGVKVVRTIAKQTRREKQMVQQKEEELEEEVRSLLKLAAHRDGHPEALIRLGNIALEEAREVLQSSLNNKNNDSDQMLLMKEKVDEALDLYKRSGENGSSEGWFNRGQLLWTGFPDQSSAEDQIDDDNAIIVLKRSVSEANEAFQKAVDLGDYDAMYFLGVELLGDTNSDADKKTTLRKGLAMMEKAANEGRHGGAMYYLALFYRNGFEPLDISPCPTEEFVERLDQAADEAGDSNALFYRGHNYYHGEDGRTDVQYEAALRDFVAAAQAGNADGAISAGAMLYQQERYEQAFELYQMAADMGSMEGWRNIVSCYATGRGVRKNEAMAKYIANTMLLKKDEDG